MRFTSLFLSVSVMAAAIAARPPVAMAEEGNQNKIALVMKALSNPFFAKMEDGAKAYAKEKNLSLEVFGVEREDDVDQQIGIVQSLTARGYAAIVLAPADSKKLVPACKAARDKGVVVINIDNPLHAGSMAQMGISIPFVGSDNKAGAALAGQYLAMKLGGKGHAAIIEGIRGVENAELRKAGFVESLKAGTHVEVVASESANWHMDESLAKAATILKAQKPDAILCANDNMALGALQALDMTAEAGKVLIVGYDNIDAVRAEMRTGRIQATVEQHPELMGEYGVALAAQAMKGKTIASRTATPLDLVTAESFGKKIGLSLSDTEQPFFAALRRGAADAAQLHGAELVCLAAKNDAAQQVADIQSMISRKVDLIIVNPVDSQLVAPAIELANAAGVPVVTVDRNTVGGTTVCHVASDNLAGGRLAGEHVTRLLGGKGRILEIAGIVGTTADQGRQKGFHEVILKSPGLSVVAHEAAEFDRAKAKQVMARLLQEHLSVDLIFAHNDQMILGVIDAMDEAKLTKRPLLVGFDGVPAALDAVKEGKLAATVVQQPQAMGRLAVQSAVEFFRGQKPAAQIVVDLSIEAR